MCPCTTVHNQTSPYVKQMPLLKSSDSYVVSCVEHIKFIVVCVAVDDNIYGEYISVVQLRLHVTHSCHHLWAIKIAAENL